MSNLKLLILPSWYPNKNNPVEGIFFKEQAEALSQYVDVAVLNINFISLVNPSRIFTEKRTNIYKRNGVSTFEFNYVNWIPKTNTIHDLLYKKILIKGYKKLIGAFGKPDLIHAHVTYPAGYGATILSKKFNIPFIVTEHATYFETAMMQKHKAHLLETLEFANYYTAVSGPLKNKIVDAGRKQCKVIPNFVRMDKFNTNTVSRSRHFDYKFDLLNVSNMTDKKGIDILLKALHKIVVEVGYTNIHLHLVGAGVKKKEYENLSLNLGLQNYCTFYGQVDDNYLIRLMNSFNALVISSRKETFGVVGIEALACGIPVIATRCGGPEDYVTKEVGLLVETENVDALSEAIITTIENYEDYNADKIKKYFYEKYSDKAICKEIINTYNEVLKKENVEIPSQF